MAKKFELTAELNLQSPKNIDKVLREIQRKIKSPSVDLKVTGAKQAAKDVNGVAKAANDLKKESQAASKAASALGKELGTALKNVLRYDIARRIFYSVASAIEQGVKDAVSFEREMIKIKQVSRASEQEISSLKNTITGLSTQFGIASSSLVKTGLILKQTGLSIRDTQFAMEALAKTELAPTFGSIADTAETAVAAMRQFKIEAKDLEGLLDKINVVAANFAIESEDIGVAIKRAGGAFSAAGGQIEQLIALMTSVRSTTRETAETIATGFRTIFTRLQRPTTIKFLRQFGIELTDLEGRFIGPFQAVEKLNNALANLDPSDLRFSAIVEQLGGFRQVSKVIPLIKQFDVAQQAMNAQMRATGSLSRDAEVAQEALAIRVKQLSEEIKALFRSFTESAGFQFLTDGAIALAKAITNVADALGPLLPMFGLLAISRSGSFFGKKGVVGGLIKGGKDGGAGNFMGFNRGGKVPGVGNADSIPAMLTPGEFVVNKKAAQRMGFAKLHGINRLHEGGFPDETDAERHKRELRQIRFTNARSHKGSTGLDPAVAARHKRTEEAASRAGRVNVTTGQGTTMDDVRRLERKNASKIPSVIRAGAIPREVISAANTGVQNITQEMVDAAVQRAEQAVGKSSTSSDPIDFSGFGPPSPKPPEIPDFEFERQFDAFRSDEKARSKRVEEIINRPVSPSGPPVLNIREGAKGKSGFKDRAGFASDAISQATAVAAKNVLAISGAAALGKQFGVLNEETADLVGGFGVAYGQLKGLEAGLSSLGKALGSQGMQDRGKFGLLAAKNAGNFRADNRKFEKASEAFSLSAQRLDDAKVAREKAIEKVQTSTSKNRKKREANLFAADEQFQIQQSNNELVKKNFESQKLQQEANQKAIKRSKQFTAALTVAAAVVSQIGSALKDKALRDIEAGDTQGASGRAAVGGGLQLGAQGAMAGAMIGGPLGAAIGGLGGAVIGATTAFLEAEKRIKEVEIEKSLESIGNSVKSFNEGQISATQGLDLLNSQVNQNEKSLKDLDKATRDRAFEESQEAALAFIKGIGKSVQSVEEFDNDIQKATQTTREHALVSYLDIEAQRKLVQERLNAEEKINNMAKAAAEAAVEIQKMKGISNVIAELQSDVSEFGNSINAISNIGRGIGGAGNTSSVFDTTPRSKAGVSRFNQSISGIGSLARDIGLNDVSGDAIVGTAIQRNLSEAIAGAINTSPTGNKNINDILFEKIKDSVELDGVKLEGTIEKRLKKLFEDINITNLKEEQGEVRNAIEETLGITLDPFKDFEKLLHERNKSLKSSLDQMFSLETSFINSLRKAQDAQVQSQQNFAKNTSTSQIFETNQDVQARFFRRLDQIAGASKSVGGGTSANVRSADSVIARLQEVQKELIKNEQEKLAIRSSDTIESQTELLKTGKRLSREFNTLQTILNEYGNSQQRLTVLNERLRRAQDREDLLKGGVDKILFGDAQTSATQTRLFSAMAQAETRGSVMDLPSDIRYQVVELFKEGTELQQQIIRNDRSRIAKMLGQRPGVFNQPSKERRDVAGQIKSIEQVAAAAFAGLANVEKARINKMANEIAKQNGDFLTSLALLFKEEQARSLSLDINSQRKDDQRLQRIEGLLDRAGAGFGDEGIPKEVFDAINNPSLMKAYDGFSSAVERFGQIPILAESAFVPTKADQLGEVVFGNEFNTNIKKLIQSEKFRTISSQLEGGTGVISRRSLQTQIDAGKFNSRGQLTVAKQLKTLMSMMGVQSFPAEKDDTFGTDTLFKEVFGKTKALENLIFNLSKGFEEGSEIFAKAERDIRKDVFGDGAISVQDGFFKLSQIIEAARLAQISYIDEQNSSKLIFSQLAKIPAEILKQIRDEKLSGTLSNFRESVKSSAEELDALRTKLELVTGSRETKLETEKRQIQDLQEQRQMQRARPGESIPMVMNDELPLESSLTKTLIDGAMASIDSNKNMTETGSIYTHDVHSEDLLKEILLVLKGQGQTGTAGGEQTTLSFNRVDTTALDQSINTFSKSVTDLSEVMNTPITMEVGGEITVNVNMTGAELLQENEAAFAQIAGRKVTDGINNFIRTGLRTSSIAIKGDWAV